MVEKCQPCVLADNWIIMTLKCWPSIYNCRIHNHGGGARSGVTSFSHPQTNTSSVMSTMASSGRSLSRAGGMLQAMGAAQVAAAPFHNPYKNKIWTPMTKSEARTRFPGMLKNSKRYDWRPRGDYGFRSTSRDANLYRSKHRVRGRREAHWHRQPRYNEGIYSNPSPGERSHFKASQTKRGFAKFGVGTTMKYLGRGFTLGAAAYYGYQLYKDPSMDTVMDIHKDVYYPYYFWKDTVTSIFS